MLYSECHVEKGTGLGMCLDRVQIDGITFTFICNDPHSKNNSAMPNNVQQCMNTV